MTPRSPHVRMRDLDISGHHLGWRSEAMALLSLLIPDGRELCCAAVYTVPSPFDRVGEEL